MDGNKILDGLTREQALGCVMPTIRADGGEAGSWWFVCDGKIYPCPDCIGIKTKTGHCQRSCRDCWRDAFTAYYAERDKPRWAEPQPVMANTILKSGDYCNAEVFYDGADHAVRAEIARTNARREVEAFIRANGGEGKYSLVLRRSKNELMWWIHGFSDEGFDIGSITCANEDLAAEVICRYPEQLRLLNGGRG